jgi:chromosome partitioning protein
MIVTVGGQKGGCGKTTISAEIAMSLALKGKLLFVDADPQRSATDFCNARREAKGDLEFTAIQLQDKAVRTEIAKLKSLFDFIVIDAGGHDSSGQRYALSVSDIYLAIFKPESLALWTLETVEKMVEEMSPVNEKLKSYSVLNLGWPSGSDNKESAEILDDSLLLTRCPVMIQRRKAFCDATGKGLSVKERTPADDKAINEIELLINFIEGK